uniref:Peptidase M16 C-terminal domain-containing protein n=1 Tax=mine drainage metagenome TaxID=410659 RepID=E6Q4B9_9ZZZZ
MKRLAPALLACAVLLPTFACVRANAEPGASLGHLASGASYSFAVDPASPTAAIGLWLHVPASGYSFERPGIADLAAHALADAPILEGRSLREMVESVGGTIEIEPSPNLLGISIVVPKAEAPATVRALAEAYFTGTIDAKSLDEARHETSVRAVEERFNIENELQSRLFAALFTNGPMHAPVYPNSASSLDAIHLQQVRHYAERAFRPGNASLSFAGAVDASLLTQIAAVGRSGNDAPIESPPVEGASTQSVQGSSPAIAIGFAGPPITSRDDATALDFVASALLDRELGRALPLPAGGVAVARFVTLQGTGVFTIFGVGKDPKKMESVLLNDLARLRTPLSRPRFDRLLRAFRFHLASAIDVPQGLADNLGWYAASGDAAYAPGLPGGQYARSILRLTPESVAAAVRRYLEHPTTILMTAVAEKSA